MIDDKDYSRKPFSEKTKRLADERCGGLCEICGEELIVREYDHITDCFWGGMADLDNCQVLCPPCHREKTDRDAPLKAKSRRLVNQRMGLPKKKGRKQKIKSGGFDKRYKRKVNGKVVRREPDRNVET